MKPEFADAILGTMRPLRVLLAIGFTSILACGVEAQPPRDKQGTATRTPLAPIVESVPIASRSCATRSDHDVTLSRDVEPILVSRCSGEFCHGLTMTSASRTYAFLVNQYSRECNDPRALVAPGDLEHSYLVDKILGLNLCSGHPMPRGLGNRLSPEQVRTVTEWICEGAPND